jgi:hypothetical protein
MELQQQFAREGIEMRRFEYGDRTELVADLGRASQPSVDVVGDTVIVVVDGEQHEVEVSADVEVFITNGVLTLEVKE